MGRHKTELAPVTQSRQALAILCAAMLAALFVSSAALAAHGPAAPVAPAACAPLDGFDQIPDATVVDFDDLPAGTSIGGAYQPTHGVRFAEGRTARVIAYDHPLPRSAPMVAMSQTDGDPASVALNFYFDIPQTHVGMVVGNGSGVTTAHLEGYDADGALICTANVADVPDSHTAFIGFRDDAGRIASAALSYMSTRAESLDDLHFSSAPPANTPTATATATPTATRPAPSTAALFVFPAAAAPGGEPAVSGYGLPSMADLRLILTCPAGAELDLGAAGTDGDGLLTAAVVMPAYPPNPCVLAAREGATTLAETRFTLLPALELDFSPQVGPPGTVVSFTVRNLVAGELRLDYAGRAVFGPEPVAAGIFSGTFTVPRGRPDPLGSVAEIRAANLLLGRAAGVATGSFHSQAAPTSPAYRVADLRLPGVDLAPGSDFTITGHISPAPQAPLSQFKILPVWRKADGRTLPIGRGSAQIAADGAFSVPARVPSLLTGDPTWPEAGDLAGVMLVTPAGQPQPFLQAITDVPIFPTFNVKVVDAATEQLIPSAKVSFEIWQAYTLNANSLPLSEVAGAAATGVSNQIGQVLGTTELTDDEKALIALTKAICVPLTIPVNGTEWEVTSPTLDQALSEPSVQGLFLANSILVEAAAAAGQDLTTGSLITQAQSTSDAQLPVGPRPGAQLAGAPAAADVIPYLLTVDALDAGYGLKDADGTVKNLSLRVYFHLADLTYRDLKGNVLPNPYTVKLGKLSSGDQSALGPIKVFLAGIGAPQLPGPTAPPRFARYFSAKNVPAGVQVVKADGSALVTLSYAQFHKLGAGGMQLYLDGVWQANFTLQFNAGLACKNGTVTWTSPPFYQGKAVIPNAHLLAPGSRALRVRAQILNGQWVNYDYILQVDALPASWFAVQSAGTRTLNWGPGQVRLFTQWLKPEAHTQWLHSDPAQTDETGQLDNRTIPTSNISQQAQANGHKGGQTAAQLSGQALNKYGQGASLSHSSPASADAAGALQAGAMPAETLHATSLHWPRG